MVDHTPGPADAPWLADALRAIAEQAPVAPAPPLDAADAPAGGGRTRRVVVAAAVLVLLAAVALLARTDDRPAVQVPAGVRSTAPTGWFAPSGLPARWKVVGVVDLGSVRPCPCVDRIWTGPAGAWVGYSSDPAAVAADWNSPEGIPLAGGVIGNLRSNDVVPIDLGQGITGTIREGAPGVYLISWVEGDRARRLGGGGVDDQELMAAARALVGEADPDASPVPGWERTYELDAAGATTSMPLVAIEAEAPSGHRVRALLMASGDAARFSAGSIPRDRVVSGQELSMAQLGATEGRDRSVDPLIGQWPGSDVYVEAMAAGGEATQAEVDRFAASLRPLTAEEWRRFVERYGAAEERLADARTFNDLPHG